MFESNQSIAIPFPWVWKHLERDLRFRPNELTHPVIYWVEDRPIMKPMDSKVAIMALRTVDEIYELEEERNLLVDNGNIEHDKELSDVLFFIISFAHSLGLAEEIDMQSIASNRRVNGAGSRSDVTDTMKKVAGNMEKRSTAKKEIEWLIGLWMSYWKYGPVSLDPVTSMRVVLHKNGTRWAGNHPAIYYSDLHPRTGKKLNPDQQEQRSGYSRVALRQSRTKAGNRKEGMKAEDHLPYAPLILDFERGAEGLEELSRLLQLPVFQARQLLEYGEHLRSKSVTSFRTFQNSVRSAM